MYVLSLLGQRRGTFAGRVGRGLALAVALLPWQLLEQDRGGHLGFRASRVLSGMWTSGGARRRALELEL